jgi:2-oxoglutarate ferredoxin oxidoreductase subunit delta
MVKSKRVPILKPPQPNKKYEIIFDTEQCDGCKLCVEFCPKELLETDDNKFNSRMLHYVVVIAPEDCVGCKQCERMCPTASIFINEIEIMEEERDE